MHRPGFRLTTSAGPLREAFAEIRAELDLPTAFSATVLEEAQRAAAEATFGRPVEIAAINERFTL